MGITEFWGEFIAFIYRRSENERKSVALKCYFDRTHEQCTYILY